MDKVSIWINGVERKFIIGDAQGCVKPSETLVHTLRDRLDLTGTKIGCDHGACGFCTPGIVMSAKALLDKNPDPTREDIREALSGNYCRCISHYQVEAAIEDAIRRMKDLRAKGEA